MCKETEAYSPLQSVWDQRTSSCCLNLFLIALLKRKKKREKYKLGGVYVNIFFTVYLLIVYSKQSTDRLRALASTQGETLCSVAEISFQKSGLDGLMGPYPYPPTPATPHLQTVIWSRSWIPSFKTFHKGYRVIPGSSQLESNHCSTPRPHWVL